MAAELPPISTRQEFRHLHLRFRADMVEILHALADYDTARRERRIYTTELYRAAIRNYINQRVQEDPGVAALVADLTTNPNDILARVNGTESRTG
tara:strand:- start:82 stop:366 length:285 start_codon:yes stop_codon:yes gene_type:complete